MKVIFLDNDGVICLSNNWGERAKKWANFKRDNPDLVGEIEANEFKNIIYTFISPDRIIKPRNKFGALEIKNIRWKIEKDNK